ncbi:MAG: cysteine synthase A [Gammaproteobacteria bacterium]|jgi:cysteine synthase A
MTPGLKTAITDQAAYDRNVQSLHGVGLALPRISDLADPPAKLAGKMVEISKADPDAPDARNLFRVHWHNGADRAVWCRCQSIWSFLRL